MSKVSPGWYPDPTNPFQERLWDGDTWTDRTRTLLPQPYQVQSLVPGPTSGKVYAIGEVGPGGGIVFITPSTEGNSTGQYFEAAPHVVKAIWATEREKLGATSTGIGTGATNTAASYTDGACKIASEYSNNGFSDWFLPSKDELNEMFKNRKFLGKHRRGVYWSSSEFDADDVWFQNFYNGIQSNGYETITIFVCPVRAFS